MDYPGYVPGPAMATTLAHIPDPPGQNITFRLVHVPATIGLPNRLVSGSVPVPGTLFGFVTVVNAVPGGWNIQ